jgi:hypothetical protein
VKRFNLPDEFNHITIIKTVIARGGSEQRQALEMLINERMNRHQYPQAAELLRDVKKLASGLDDKSNVQLRIDQIVKNWLQIEGTSVQPAGQGATLDLRFRNGSKATFEARPINIDALLTDVRKYIESKPKELDYQRQQIDNIGWMLIRNDNAKYLEKTVAKWELELKAPANHFDAMQTVTTPLQKAGAYWVTAKMQDGNEARIVLWVADTAISRKRTEDGTLYFVADAVTGAPIDRADLEFFGWHQEYKGGQNYEIFDESLCCSDKCRWPGNTQRQKIWSRIISGSSSLVPKTVDWRLTASWEFGTPRNFSRWIIVRSRSIQSRTARFTDLDTL